VEHNGMKDHWKVSRQKAPKAKQDQHRHNAEKQLVRERSTDHNEQKKKLVGRQPGAGKSA